MEFKYTVHNNDEKIEDRWGENRSRKIRDPITIEMKVEMDKTQYEKLLSKYKTPLGEKISKIFGF